MEHSILTAKEAADILRISRSQLYAMIRSNEIPHISLGKRQVIPARQLHDWLDKRTEGGN